MQISLDTLLLYTAIVLLAGFGIGAWITRTLLRYPFGANPLTGKDAYIGLKGKVVEKKDGYLRVFVNSQVWTAESEHFDLINIGDRVAIRDVNNLTLKVEPVEGRDGIIPDHQENRA